MNKKELLTIIKERLELKSLKEAEVVLGQIDTIFEVIGEALEVDAKVKVGTYFSVEKKHVEEKSGVAMGKEFTTPEHDKLVLKGTKALKELVK